VPGNAVVQFVLAFASILALKWGYLTRGPVWDTAMGLFPAALTLADSGFDLLALLGTPGYAAGGPNVHGTSSVTLLTAVVWMLSGGGTKAFVVLHLLHFSAAAAGLTALYRYARPVFNPVGALLLSVSVLLCPIFLVQVGYLYLEVPLFLCTVSALLAWVEGRFRPAALWAAAAFSVKQTGIIVPATLVAAVLLQRRPFAGRVWRAAQMIALPALWWAGTMVLRSAATGESLADLEAVPSFEGMGSVWHNVVHFLFRVPDVLVLVYAFICFMLYRGRTLLRALRTPPADGNAPPPEGRVAVCSLLILSFLSLVFWALPKAAQYTLVLPRYYVVVLPFLLLCAGDMVRRLPGGSSERRVARTFGALTIFFALNHGGRFYPTDIDIDGPGNDFSVTERSDAYLRLDAVQREAMAFLGTLPEGVPVYYGHYEHYLLSYPALGYVTRPLTNGHNLHVEPPTSLLEDPSTVSCLYVLYNYPWLGGAWARRLFQLADSDERLSRQVVREFRDGRYVIYLIRIRNRDADCALSRS